MKPAAQHYSPPLHRNSAVIAVVAVVASFLGMWAVVLGAGASGGSHSGVTACSSLIVVGAPLIALAIVFSWAGVLDAFIWLFRSPERCPAARDAAMMFQLGASFTLGFGFVGTLVGLVVMLTHLGHPRDLGPGLAMTLISQLEGIVISGLYLAAAARIMRRHIGFRLLSPLARRSVSIAGVTVIAGTLTTLAAFFILRLSICPAL